MITCIVLAIGIFVIDTLSPLEFAVAVLYVVVVIGAATYFQRRGALIAALSSSLLTVASFMISHGIESEGAALLRVIVSLSAIGVTTLLVLLNLSANESLRASERIRANLSRFFSPQTIDEIVAIDVPLSVARHQPAAIMFVDMVGFTAYSSQRTPEAVITMLRELVALLGNAVFVHHGTIDKFLGDGLLAVFGSPLPSPRDQTNAANCALEIIRSVGHWNSQRHRLGELPIQVAVGIHSGDVVLGDVGSDTRLEFTVIGDTVNIASRVEAYCRVLDADVLITDAFLRALQTEGCFEAAEIFNDQGWHVLRGHTEPIHLYGVRRGGGELTDTSTERLQDEIVTAR
jgi:adenylate cyclase